MPGGLPLIARQAIRVYLGVTRFPTAPQRITLADASTVLSYDIIARGAIAMPRGYQPTRCALEGTFFGYQRGHDIPYLADPWIEPYALCRDLAAWCQEADVVGSRHLVITGLGVTFDAFPESFSWSPKGGWGDADYQLSLYEERPLAADGLSWTNAPGASGARWRYRTGDGETLGTIASQQLGDSSRWTEILVLNRDLPGVLNEELPAGTTLTMPPTSWRQPQGGEYV